jgi:hypothetical protein
MAHVGQGCGRQIAIAINCDGGGGGGEERASLSASRPLICPTCVSEGTTLHLCWNTAVVRTRGHQLQVSVGNETLRRPSPGPDVLVGSGQP